MWSYYTPKQIVWQEDVMNALIAFYEKKSLLNLLKITKNLAKTSSKKYWHITRNHFSYMGRLLRRQYKQFMYNALIFVSTWESQQSTRETIIIFLAVHQNIPFIRTSPQKNYKKKKRIPKIFYFFLLYYPINFLFAIYVVVAAFRRQMK